jgi:ferredoxin
VRELDEELGVAAEVGSWLDGVTHEYDDRVVRLRFYRCRLTRGEPSPVRCHAVRWVAPAQLPRYEFPEADSDLVAWLSAPARRQSGRGRERSLSRVEFIEENGAAVEMPHGASLEAAAERCGARVRFGCRTGDCGSCLVRIVRGAARVSGLTAAEIAFFTTSGAGDSAPRGARARPQLRLACQARALGDVALTAAAAATAGWI